MHELNFRKIKFTKSGVETFLRNSLYNLYGKVLDSCCKITAGYQPALSTSKATSWMHECEASVWMSTFAWQPRKVKRTAPLFVQKKSSVQNANSAAKLCPTSIVHGESPPNHTHEIDPSGLHTCTRVAALRFSSKWKCIQFRVAHFPSRRSPTKTVWNPVRPHLSGVHHARKVWLMKWWYFAGSSPIGTPQARRTLWTNCK